MDNATFQELLKKPEAEWMDEIEELKMNHRIEMDRLQTSLKYIQKIAKLETKQDAQVRAKIREIRHYLRTLE